MEPATTRQTWALKCLTGKDYREANLSKEEASKMIGELMAAKGLNKETTKTNFTKLIAQATEAANRAGDEWMAQATPKFRVVERADPLDDNSPVVRDFGTMLDVCGIVFLKCTDKRTAFAKWLKTVHKDADFVRIPHKYTRRQEWGLGEACEGAALKVLTDAGIKGIEFYSRID